MTLSAGSKLGLYEILSPLGAGGMGEVYLARDGKLDREIAIKVLPEAMTRDPERVARFEREAKVLASLNHPNIASVYGFDESNGTRFLVLEYVEGETLGRHLKRGPMATEDALDIAKQIAEALEAAHGEGVIHRDLKPANVMIRPDGTVKVLDFGLAKAMAEESSAAADANSPTITANFTRPGVVLGTAAYMSPEQARGRPLDKRTDIWSFGIILFECLTGSPLFQGETANDSMGAILHKDPDWSLLPPGTPPTIQLLLRRCLSKDRKRRLHDIADARIELENSIVDPASTSLGLAAAALDVPARRLPWRWAVVLATAFAVLGAGASWFLKPPPASRVVRLTLSIPRQYDLASWSFPTFSPDGKVAVFLGDSPNSAERTLVVRMLDQQEFRPLRGTGRARYPFFSPDGEWVAFWQEGKLKKVSIRGGPPITLCDAPSMRGGTWRSDGSIVFASTSSGGLMRISASGGTPEPFTTPPDAESFASHRLPYALPNGGVLLTLAVDFAQWGEASIMVVPATGGAPIEVIKDGGAGRYVAPGFLVFMREGTLMAARFDPDRLELSGQPFPVVEGITAPGPAMAPQFSIDTHGTLMYMTGSTDAERRLVLIDHSGNEEKLGEQTGDFGEPRLSPDGRHIAIDLGQGSRQQIGILERARDILRTLPAATPDSDPIWSPDGKWLVFASRRHGGVPNLYRVRADFSGEVERLTESVTSQIPMDWAPDGRSLLFMEITPATDGDIGLLRFGENG
ncbi:MAG: serine/threonine-protein kinase, partial [Planctomycetes bacterium]|nr:serine/threonine-protein kinase [Planctomycetota bacterium]